MKLLLVTIGILAVAFAFPNNRDDEAGPSSAPASDGQSRNETDDGGDAEQQQHQFINFTLPDGQHVSIQFDPSGPIQPRPFIGWRDILKYISSGLDFASSFPG
uniref:Putative secreted protein n=1 Tax=Psorophora albipes TaxID=869069 RepID=T1E3C4_9DIPT